jgi:hypothetical protein
MAMKNLSLCLFVIALAAVGCENKPAATPKPSMPPAGAMTGHAGEMGAAHAAAPAAGEKKEGEAAPAEGEKKEGEAAAPAEGEKKEAEAAPAEKKEGEAAAPAEGEKKE